VSVEVEVSPVKAEGWNNPVIPAGAPLRLKVTTSVKFVRVIVTDVLLLAPWTIVSAVGASASV
jgi:hypothetical protein